MFVVNEKWRSMFEEMRVEALSGRCSDHLPILLSINEGEQRRRRKQLPFGFEACWIKQEECEQEIRRGWEEGHLIPKPLKRVQTRLQFCSGSLVTCFKGRDKGRGMKIEQLTKKIKEVQGVLCQKNMWELKNL